MEEVSVLEKKEKEKTLKFAEEENEMKEVKINNNN